VKTGKHLPVSQIRRKREGGMPGSLAIESAITGELNLILDSHILASMWLPPHVVKIVQIPRMVLAGRR